MPDHRRAFGAIDRIRAPSRIIGGHFEMCAQLLLKIGVAAAVAEATRPLSQLGRHGPACSAFLESRHRYYSVVDESSDI